MAKYYATQLGTPSGTSSVKGIRFLANQSDALMLAALQGDISSKVVISESVTGLASATFCINAVKLELTETGLVYCTWLLVPADTTAYWKLGTSTLGSGTVLGF